jgi:hypothetical protein
VPVIDVRGDAWPAREAVARAAVARFLGRPLPDAATERGDAG